MGFDVGYFLGNLLDNFLRLVSNVFSSNVLADAGGSLGTGFDTVLGHGSGGGSTVYHVDDVRYVHPGYYLFFLGVLLTAFVTERVVHAVCSLLWHVVHNTKSDVKTLSAMGLVTSVFTGASSVTTSAFGVVGSIFSSLVTAMFWVLGIAAIGVMLTVLYEYFPGFLEVLFSVWNSGLGAFLRAMIHVPALVVYYVLWPVIPIWNALIWTSGKLITAVLLPGLHVEWESFLRAVSSLQWLVRHLAESLAAWIETLNSCEPVQGVTDVRCFEPGLRTLDLVTPMGDIRNMAGFLVLIIRGNCGLLQGPIDLILYPLMDINLAKAVHNFVNSLLFFVVQTPIITVERCLYATSVEGWSKLNLLMCTPDIEPSITMMASAFRHFGRMVDNWMDITAIVIEELTTGSAPGCEPVPFTLDAAGNGTGLFGLNTTTVVGITPGMYARTDGWAAEYTLLTRQVERISVVRAWPIPITVGYGVAAVHYGSSSQPDDEGHMSTSMLGCKCYDVVDSQALQGTRMEIVCAITPFDPEAFDTMEINMEDYLLPVSFRTVDAGRFMECRQAHISVQSVRWPVTREARVDNVGVIKNVRDQILDYADAGVMEEPVEVDAIVYVVPRCLFGGSSEAGTAAGSDAACIEGYRYAGCFPYCFAARTAGSTNSVLTLYDADEWEDTVQLLNRDCGLGTLTLPPDLAELFSNEGTGGGTGFKYTRDDRPTVFEQIIEILGNDIGGNSYTVRPVPTDAARSGACKYDIRVSTRAQRSSLTSYENLASVRLEEQPFATAGDAQLLVEWDNTESPPRAYVRVRRLYGSDTGHVTLMTHSERIPTIGTCRLLSDCSEVKFNPSLITVPRAYSDTAGNAGPNVATKWSVFYSVNPSVSIYSEYFLWCKNNANIKTQFQKDTSFGPPRVWRIDAFSKNAGLEAGVRSVPSFVEFDGFSKNTNWATCSLAVNISVSSMAFLNDYNVAVTTLVASPRYYDYENEMPSKFAPIGTPEVRYVVYYLNPQTMRMRTDALWEEDVAVATLGQGQLCPAMRRLPPAGSLVAELMVSLLYVLRLPVMVVSVVPALVKEPGSIAHLLDCPLVTRGHTLLRECGRSIFSLDKAFDASRRANSHAWRTLGMLGAALTRTEGGDQKAKETFNTVLTGMAQVGENTYNLVDRRLANVALRMARTFTSRGPEVLRTTYRLVLGGVMMGEFLFKFAETFVMKVITGVAQAGGGKSDLKQRIEAVGTGFWNTLHDMRFVFHDLVIHPSNKACTGLGIMLGYGNPVAQFARASCLTGVATVEGTLEFLSVLFVDYPIMNCLCKTRPGSEYVYEIGEKCFSGAPLEYRSVIVEVVEIGIQYGDTLGQQRAMCVAMTSIANDRLFHVWDTMFSLMYDTVAAVEPLFDYMIHVDGDSGLSCSSFYSSPYVMALMPYPLDYFRVCGETPVCRYRCLELFEAFEESRDSSLRRGGKQQEFTTVIDHPFFTEDDIVNGRILPPFEVLAMIEFENCLRTCGETENNATFDGAFGGMSRCFGVTGFAASGPASGSLEVKTYCSPVAPGTGIRPVESFFIRGSSEWATTMAEVYFLSPAGPLPGEELGGPKNALVVVLTDGVKLVSEAGAIRSLVRVMGSGEVYKNTRMDAMHFIEGVVIVPFSSSVAYVLVTGRTEIGEPSRESYTEYTTKVHCTMFTLTLSELSSVGGVEANACPDASNVQLGASTRTLVLTHPLGGTRGSVQRVLLLPESDETQLGVCEFSEEFMSVSCAFSKGQNQMATNGVLSGSASRIGYMFSSNGQSIRRSTAVSQTGRVLPFDDRGEHEIFSTFSAAHSTSNGQWLADVRFKVPTKRDAADDSLTPAQAMADITGTVSGDVSVVRTSSSPVNLYVTLERECTVMSCGGCKSKVTQRHCFAAQQCSIAKCVGSTVNMNRPLCMLGKLAGDIMDGYVAVLVSSWITMYEMTALIVDSSMGIIVDQVTFEFPYDVVNIIACDTKDVIVSVIGFFSSAINAVSVLALKKAGDASSTAVMQTVAMSTQVMATLTNLVAHICYIVLYYSFAWVQLLACNVNQVLMFMDVTGMQVRVGTERQVESLSAVGGQCMAAITSEASIDAGSVGHSVELLRSSINNAVTAARSYGKRARLEDLAKKDEVARTVATEGAKKATVQKSSGVMKSDGKWVPDHVRWQTIMRELEQMSFLQAELPEQQRPGDVKKKNPYAKTNPADSAKGKKKLGTLRSGLNSVSNRLITDAGTVNRGIKKSPGRMMRGASSTFLKKDGAKRSRPWMDAVVHLLDATITWVQGILYSIMDLLQVSDTQNCRLPDITVRDAPACACGDTPFIVPDVMAVQRAKDSAFWCSGTLQLVDNDGRPYIIFNPYSLFELRVIVAKTIDKYLDCVATGGTGFEGGCSDLEPHAPYLLSQDASTLAVLTRCKANYVNKQWDIAAAVLFNYTAFPALSESNTGVLIRSNFNINTYPYPEVASCMLQTLSAGQTTDRCLELYLQTQRQRTSEHFLYEELSVALADGRHGDSSAYIDACEVFTGPASRGIEEFQHCVDDSNQGDCELEYFVWAGRSANRVPVASPHYRMASPSEVNRVAEANEEVKSVRDHVVNELTEFINTWDGSGIEISLFTVEGDLLHQMFDCMVMGPYAAADMWPADSTSHTLPALRYSRRPDSEIDERLTVAEQEEESYQYTEDTEQLYESQGAYIHGTSEVDVGDRLWSLSREFELPCTGAALHGDDKGPFTCGSTARRAVIKHFVRDKMGGDDGITQRIIELTRQQVRNIRDRWNDERNFGCPCASGAEPSESCCTADDVAGWSEFKNRATDSVPINGTVLAGMLVDGIVSYTSSVMITDTHEAFTKYADDGWAEKYTWTVAEAAFAADLGLLDPTETVAFYNSDDASSPFLGGNASLWDMCTGALSHKMLTMPVDPESAVRDGGVRWEPDTVRDLGGFDPLADNAGLYTSSLEEFVKLISLSAMDLVPNYWHYVVRQVPSDSDMCLGRQTGSSQSKVNFPFNTAGLPTSDLAALILPSAALGSQYNNEKGDNYNALFSVLGAFKHSIGGMDSACVCMWEVQNNSIGRDMSGGPCYVHTDVCSHVRKNSGPVTSDTLLALLVDICSISQTLHQYFPSEHFWAVQLAVEDYSKSGAVAVERLECLSMGPSDAWGIISDAASVPWVAEQNPSTYSPRFEVRELLTEGRGGVRIGNLFDLVREWGAVVNPSRRVKPLVHSREPGVTVAQHVCASSFKGAKLPQSFGQISEKFVDDLFPVLQAVDSVPVLDHCTRFMIETARLHFYETLTALDPVFNISTDAMDLLIAELAEQATVVSVWRNRCKNQVNLLATCEFRGVFDTLPTTLSARQPASQCPFTIPDLTLDSKAYVTRGCVVYVNGEFYDPCLCSDCSKSAVKSFTLAVVQACPVTVNVRRFVSHPSTGGTLHWARQWPDYVTDEEREALVGLVEELMMHDKTDPIPPGLDGTAFMDDVVDDPKPGLFNSDTDPESSSWMTSEGFASDPGVSKFCDVMLDWWPEDWDKPVGYHVTTPPYSDEAGYRVFDNGFVVERGANEFDLVRIVYEHSYMRNASLYRDHFGAAGVCGTHSYGMEMIEMNTVRVCTQLSRDDRADPTVPIRSSSSVPENNNRFYPEQCAQRPVSSWFSGETSPGSVRVSGSSGLVGLWYDTGSRQWPPQSASLPSLYDSNGLFTDGTPMTASNAFGEESGCFQPDLFQCVTDIDCQGISLLSTATLARIVCRKSVCVMEKQVSDAAHVYECSSHEDCGDMGEKMCSGFGKCVPPVIEFRNEFSEAVEAEVFSTVCVADFIESADMFGTSQWEAVPGLLPANGMCSYRAWFEYQQLLERDVCFSRNDNTCPLNARTSFIEHTSVPGPLYQGSLWHEGRLRVEPTPCDRDYMHLEGMRACFPKSNNVISTTSDSEQQWGTLFQTYSLDFEGVQNVNLLANKQFRNTSYGFLGFKEDWRTLDDSDIDAREESLFRHCVDIEQCRLQEFFVNGFSVTERLSLDVRNVQSFYNTKVFSKTYDIRPVRFDDVFRCGVFGLKFGERGRGSDGVQLYECVLDPAVTLLYQALCYSDAGSKDRIQLACDPVIDDRGDNYDDSLCFSGVYLSNQVEEMRDRLNNMYTNFLGGTYNNFDNYLDTMECVRVIFSVMDSLAVAQYPEYTVRVSPEVDRFTTTRPQGLYYMDTYAVTEFPFAWWVKCVLLSGVELGSNRVATCNAWEDRTSRMSDISTTVRNGLMYIDGAISRSLYNSRTAGQSVDPKAFCSEATTAGTTISGHLLSLFRLARTYLTENSGPAFTASHRSCYGRKVFDRRQDGDPEWRSFVNDALDEGFKISSDQEQFLKPMPSVRESDGVGTRISEAATWVPLCRSWFGYSMQDENSDLSVVKWFETFDDVMKERMNPLLGVPIGRFPRIESVGVQDRYLDVEFRKLFDNERCDPDVLFQNDEEFCIFEKKLSDDPFQDVDLPDRDDNGELARPYVVVARDYQSWIDALTRIEYTTTGHVFSSGSIPNYAAGGYVAQDVCGMMGTKTEQYNIAHRYSISNADGESALFDNLLKIDRFSDDNEYLQDRVGRSCKLYHPSTSDNCSPAWLRSYATSMRGQGNSEVPLQCVVNDMRERVFLPGVKTTNSGPVPTREEVDRYVANPAGDVCWSAGSECLDGVLRGAETIQVPAGVSATVYQGTDTDYQVQWFPQWYLCPNTDIPKSLHSTYILQNSNPWDRSNGVYWTFTTRKSAGESLSTFPLENSQVSLGNLLRIETLDVSSMSVMSMRVALQDGCFCCDDTIGGTEGMCSTRCTFPTLSVEVGRNLWCCVRCETSRETFCVGLNGCMFSSFSDKSLTRETRQILKEANVPVDQDLTVAQFGRLLHALSVHYLRTQQNVGSGGLFYILPDTSISAVPYYYVKNLDSFTVFDSKPATEFFQTISGGNGNDVSACADSDSKLNNVNYKSCGKDENIRTLRDFVDQNYRHRSFPVVPPKQTIAWVTSRAQLTSRSIYSFSAHERELRDLFAKWLLDVDAHCERGTMYSSVCLKFPGVDQITLINPWVGGEFNPFELCDTDLDPDTRGERYIEVSCNEEACPHFYDDTLALDSFYQGMHPTCTANNRQRPRVRAPLESLPTSLCSKSPRLNATCLHRQGVLGGRINVDGSARDGDVVSDLYNPVSLDTSQLRGGIFATLSDLELGNGASEGRNHLLAGKTREASGYTGTVPVQVSVHDIGGHHIRLELGEDSMLRVSELPLGSETDNTANIAPRTYAQTARGRLSQRVTTWMDEIEGTMRFESFTIEGQTPPTSADRDKTKAPVWDCAHRRLRFWSSSVHDGFGTVYPEPRRTRQIFGRLNEDSFAHPLFKAGSEVGKVNKVSYLTSNGVCVCVNPADCRKSVNDSDVCSLRDTILSLCDRKWRRLQNVDPLKVCHDQVDWPYHGGTLRDETAMPGVRFQDQCSLLDRMPPLSVRYNTVPLEDSYTPLTTLDEGGDCHMGRAATVDPTLKQKVRSSKCRLAAKTETYMDLECDSNVGRPTEIVRVQRERSKMPSWLIEKTKEYRRECKSASPPPAFQNRDGTRIRNVSSFGVPVRISPERFIASDLHHRLCKVVDGCESKLNMSQWQTRKFLFTLLQDPLALFNSTLLKNFTMPGSSVRNQTRKTFEEARTPSDSKLWAHNWVSCSRNETGGNITNCTGRMTKEEWMNRTDRARICADVFIRGNEENPLVADFPICDLTGETDQLCAVIAQAENDILDAHCLAAGECLKEVYYYSPSVYSVTNGEFVRETVQDFYLQANESACPEQDERLLLLIEQNNQLRKHCAAVEVLPMMRLMENLRLILHIIVRIQYYYFMMFMSFFDLLMEGVDVNEVMRRVFGYAGKFFVEAAKLVEGIGKAVFQLVMESPFGVVLREIIKGICVFINFIQTWILRKAMCPVMKPVIGAIRWLGDFMRSLRDVEFLGLKPFGWINFGVFFDTWEDVLVALADCDKSNPLCEYSRTTQFEEDGTLPTATRCWAEYVTSFGDANSLSCTAADTCVTSDVGGDLVVCDGCPLAPTGVQDFGCDPIRKVCSCSVPITERTPCVNHKQCRTESQSTCVFMDDDIMQTFGNVPCRSCSSEQMCIMIPGEDSYGYCSCMLRPQRPLQCDVGSVGERVTPDPTALCLTGLGSMSKSISRSSSFSTEYDRLAAMPCAMADISSSFCFQVYLDALSYTSMIVVLDSIALTEQSLGPFRRLFGANIPDDIGFSKATGWVHRDWHDVTGMCTQLVSMWRLNASAESFSVTDQRALRDCIHWRHLGFELISRYNLTNVTDHFLLSWEDFAHEIQHFSAFAELVSTPAVLLEAFMHSSCLAPLRSVMGLLSRWTEAYVESFAASNQTVTLFDTLIGFVHAIIQHDISSDFPTSLTNNSKTSASAERDASALVNYQKTLRNIIPFIDQPFGVPLNLNISIQKNETPEVRETMRETWAQAEPEFKSRRMFEWRDRLTDIEMFSTDVLLKGGQLVDVPAAVGEQWVNGPATWPPDISYWSSNSSCSVGDVTLEILQTAVGSVSDFIGERGPERMKPPTSFSESGPKVSNYSIFTRRPERLAAFNSTRADIALRAVNQLRLWLWEAGFDEEWFISLFTSIPVSFRDMLECQLEEVQFCTNYRRTLWNSFWWVFIYMVCISFVMSVLHVPFIQSVLFVLFPFFVLHYSTNYGLFCIPMIPTCVLDEALEIVSALFPTELSWPNSLQKYPGCIADLPRYSRWGRDPPQESPDCFRSCMDDPFAFTRWEATAAWWVCDWNRHTCLEFREWLANHTIPFSTELQAFIAQKAEALTLRDSDMIAGQRICAVLTLWYIAPWIMLVNAILISSVWLLAIPIAFLQSFIVTFFQGLVFTHVNGHSSAGNERNRYVLNAVAEAELPP